MRSMTLAITRRRLIASATYVALASSVVGLVIAGLVLDHSKLIEVATFPFAVLLSCAVWLWRWSEPVEVAPLASPTPSAQPLRSAWSATSIVKIADREVRLHPYRLALTTFLSTLLGGVLGAVSAIKERDRQSGA